MADLSPLRPNSGRQFFFFFFKNLAWSVTRYHGTLSEKTNDPILRKFSDGWTDGRTNIQTEESDFIGCCPTNVELPIIVLLRLISAKIANYDFM